MYIWSIADVDRIWYNSMQWKQNWIYNAFRLKSYVSNNTKNPRMDRFFIVVESFCSSTGLKFINHLSLWRATVATTKSACHIIGAQFERDTRANGRPKRKRQTIKCTHQHTNAHEKLRLLIAWTVANSEVIFFISFARNTFFFSLDAKPSVFSVFGLFINGKQWKMGICQANKSIWRCCTRTI